jgi:Protoglobin
METPSQIFGYAYGAKELARSPVTLEELAALKVTTGFAEEDQQALHLAGEVLRDQMAEIVKHWRSNIIAGIPNLARHSRTPAGEPLPQYLGSSSRRFEQWILDTCFKPYDQDWLNYQHEIALRHTQTKKNQVDGVSSTAFVPYRDIVAFVPVMNQTLKPYLAAKGNSPEEVERMHQAWCKSIQLQISLWGKAYFDEASAGSNEW